jgi:hypothetical protein
MVLFRVFAITALLCGLLSLPHNSYAQEPSKDGAAVLDSDRDGLSDALEQALLVQFAPSFRSLPSTL